MRGVGRECRYDRYSVLLMVEYERERYTLYHSLSIRQGRLASEYLEHFLTVTRGFDFFEDLHYLPGLVNKESGPADAHVFSSHEALGSINAVVFRYFILSISNKRIWDVHAFTKLLMRCLIVRRNTNDFDAYIVEPFIVSSKFGCLCSATRCEIFGVEIDYNISFTMKIGKLVLLSSPVPHCEVRRGTSFSKLDWLFLHSELTIKAGIKKLTSERCLQL